MQSANEELKKQLLKFKRQLTRKLSSEETRAQWIEINELHEQVIYFYVRITPPPPPHPNTHMSPPFKYHYDQAITDLKNVRTPCGYISWLIQTLVIINHTQCKWSSRKFQQQWTVSIMLCLAWGQVFSFLVMNCEHWHCVDSLRFVIFIDLAYSWCILVPTSITMTEKHSCVSIRHKWSPKDDFYLVCVHSAYKNSCIYGWPWSFPARLLQMCCLFRRLSAWRRSVWTCLNQLKTSRLTKTF